MTAVAEQLDQHLKSLPAAMAASVEQVMWDVLKMAESAPKPASRAEILVHQQHLAACMKLGPGLDWSDLERPAQGVDEIRVGD